MAKFSVMVSPLLVKQLAGALRDARLELDGIDADIAAAQAHCDELWEEVSAGRALVKEASARLADIKDECKPLASFLDAAKGQLQDLEAVFEEASSWRLDLEVRAQLKRRHEAALEEALCASVVKASVW